MSIKTRTKSTYKIDKSRPLTCLPIVYASDNERALLQAATFMNHGKEVLVIGNDEPMCCVTARLHHSDPNTSDAFSCVLLPDDLQSDAFKQHYECDCTIHSGFYGDIEHEFDVHIVLEEAVDIIPDDLFPYCTAEMYAIEAAIEPTPPTPVTDELFASLAAVFESAGEAGYTADEATALLERSRRNSEAFRNWNPELERKFSGSIMVGGKKLVKVN